MKKTGVVCDFFETGCEGVVWVFYEDGKENQWDAFNALEKGDWLKIFKEDGSVAFEGKINPDTKIGWKKYPNNPRHGQPVALGCWIHWTQKDWKPDDWAKLFIRKDTEKLLRAEYIRKEDLRKNKTPQE